MVPITTMAHQIVGRLSPYGLPVSLIFAAVKNEPQMKVAQFQVENCDYGTKFLSKMILACAAKKIFSIDRKLLVEH